MVHLPTPTVSAPVDTMEHIYCQKQGAHNEDMHSVLNLHHILHCVIMYACFFVGYFFAVAYRPKCLNGGVYMLHMHSSTLVCSLWSQLPEWRNLL